MDEPNVRAEPVDEDAVAECWEANAAAWTALVRSGHDRWRDLVNTPAFLAFLPPVRELLGLDLGCGEGANTRAVARLGARMTGVDIAPSFVAAAAAEERREPLGIAFSLARAQALPFAAGHFDFATAFMSLMDMAGLEPALAEAHRVLRPGGFFQFSILHPCFFSSDRALVRDAAGKTVAVSIGNYFEERPWVERWTFGSLSPQERERWDSFRVPCFPRTLSAYLNALLDAGFTLERIAEPKPSPHLVREHPALQTMRVGASLLHVRVRRPR